MGKKYKINQAVGLSIIGILLLTSATVIADFDIQGSQPPATFVRQVWFNWGTASNCIPIYDCHTEDQIQTPEYQLSIHLNNPAAYVKGNTITVKVKFHSSNYNSLLIKATGTFGGFPQQLVSFTNGESGWITFIAVNPIPSSIGVNSVTWNWYLKTTGGSSGWTFFNTTHHTVYAVNKQPLTDYVWKEIVAWTCDWCQGLPNDDKQIADAILNGYDDDGVIEYGVAGWNTPEILRNGGGMCGGMKEVFYDSCATQGVYAPGFIFILKRVLTTETLWTGLVCKDPGLGRTYPGIESFEQWWYWVDSVYPCPRFLSDSSPYDDVNTEYGRYYEFFSSNDGHCINLLEYNGDIYLYDLSFGNGPYLNTFESWPARGYYQSSQIEDFRQNYFNLAVDHLDGVIYYFNSNNELALGHSFDVKTSIIPNEVNGVNQLLLRFMYSHKGLDDFASQYCEYLQELISEYTPSELTEYEESSLNAYLTYPSNPTDWQEISQILMKLGQPVNETEAVNYLNQALAIQTSPASFSYQPVPGVLSPLDMFHCCAAASLAVINS